MIAGERGRDAELVRGHRVVGVLPELLQHPAEYLRRTMIAHDQPVLRLNLGAGTIYFVTRPEDIEQVITRASHRYWKGRVFNRIAPIVGAQGLLLSEGESWLESRRLLQPAFSPRRVRSLVAKLDRIVAESVACWPARIHAFNELRNVTMRTSVAALFDSDIGASESQTISDAFDRALRLAPMRFFTYALPDWLPLPDFRDVRALRDLVAHVTRRMIDDGSRSLGNADNFLSLLLAHLQSDESFCNDAAAGQSYLLDHMSTALFGGYESTATSLTWVLLLLARHRDVCEQVCDEIAREIPDGCDISYEALARLKYTQQVLDESLRLYPPFWCSFRCALTDDTIGDVRIPAGASILMSPYATQRHPALWPDPDRFDPDRFDAERTAQRRFSYFPFLDGPRACIGKLLALTVMKLVVVHALKRYSLQLPTHFNFETTSRATIRPRQAPWLGLTARPRDRS